jgi:mannitol-1-phosphate/altronate dehydrogenase
MSTFVGFGFGAIQAGLFLYEANRSGAFERLIVAEVLSARVDAVRAAGGIFHVNIAHPDGIEQAAVGPVEIYNPAVAADRSALTEAIVQSTELATAIPSVDFYVGNGPGSLNRVLAAGLAEKARLHGPQAVVYAAENHNEAAQLLRAAVSMAPEAPAPDELAASVDFLNTVIGKMSGVVAADHDALPSDLAPVTPGAREAFLVESFNRILVSQPHLASDGVQPPFARRMNVFVEKPDLLPFEEAKLYGHNAMHAMAGYLAWLLQLETMAELSDQEDVLALVRTAALEEAGAALCRRHAGVDPLFTRDGFAKYVDDLLTRMVNPYLRDRVARVIRDPGRKLGWNDRLVGAMRVALAEGEAPQRLALGAAAALAHYTRHEATPLQRAQTVHDLLVDLWRPDRPSASDAALLSDWVVRGQQALADWQFNAEQAA